MQWAINCITNSAGGLRKRQNEEKRINLIEGNA
jgi:hypothetical protein